MRRALDLGGAGARIGPPARSRRLLRLGAACDESATLLRFLQMLVENHNHEAQTFLQQQSVSGGIDMVASTVLALRELVDTMAEQMHYVQAPSAVRAILDARPVDASIGPTVARMGGHAADLVRLIAWYRFDTAGEVRALTMQMRVAAQCFSTLAEFVQGPCPTNQSLLARMRVCDAIGGLFEFLLALQVSGKRGAGKRKKAAGGGGGGASSPSSQLASLAALSSSTDDGLAYGSSATEWHGHQAEHLVCMAVMQLPDGAEKVEAQKWLARRSATWRRRR